MEERKSKKKVVIITLIVLILLTVGIVGGYFGYKYWESNQTVGTEWGDTYCNYLQDEINQGKFAGATNGKIKLLQWY